MLSFSFVIKLTKTLLTVNKLLCFNKNRSLLQLHNADEVAQIDHW